MDRITYKDKEETLEAISKKLEESKPCLDMFLGDVYEVPMYIRIGTPYEHEQPPQLGTMKVKYKLEEARPMISVGDWVIYYYFSAEILSFELNKKVKNVNLDTFKEMFFLLAGIKDNKINVSNIRFTKFFRAITYEVELFTKICNIDVYTTVNELTWNA